MIDINIIRHQTQLVEDAIRNKGMEIDLPYLLELDRVHRELKESVDKLRAERNKLSVLMKGGNLDQSLISKSKALKGELSGLEEQLKAKGAELEKLLRKIPNIPTDDTPIGHSEEENVVAHKWGSKRDFTFKPKNHYEIAEERGWIDKERAGKVAGSRFAYLKGDLVKLQFALINWVMDLLTDESFLAEVIAEHELNVSSDPFVLILPPYFIRTELYDAMDRLEPSEDRYKIEGLDLWIQGSAEHVLGSMHANEILLEEQFPIRYLGYATSFRKEAGAAGKDMEGIIRLHQFDKLEMESFSIGQNSHDEHLFLSAIQEALMQKLGLPYQKLQKCTYDIGKPNAKGSDIEVWLPGQNRYRETHTADYMTDYQARRLHTRVRRDDKSLEHVHTNDATAIALGRTMVAIIENYQEEDMQVVVPDVLKKYLHKNEL